MAESAVRQVVEKAGPAGLIELLADDVIFRSPVVYSHYHGRDEVAVILRAVGEVFEDFRYITETSNGEGDEVLVFVARVGDREVQGVDVIRWDDDGRVAELTVFVRPMSGMLALAEAMRAKLEVAAAG